MPLNRPANARRREVRRNVARGGRRSLVEIIRTREMGWGTAYIVGLTLIATVVALSARSALPYHVGQVVEEPVVSRVDFTAVDAERTAVARALARERQPNVYRFNPALFDELREKLGAMLALADQKYAEIAPAVRDDYLSIRAHRKLEEYKNNIDGLSPEAWDHLVDRLIANLFAEVPVLTAARSSAEFASESAVITILMPLPVGPAASAGPPAVVARGPLETNIGLLNLLSVENTNEIAQRVDRLVFRLGVPRDLQETIVRVMAGQLVEPSYLFDAQETQARRDAAFAAVQPEQNDFRRNTVLVEAGTRLTEPHLALLEGEQRAWRAAQPLAARYASRAGLLVSIGLLATGVWLFIFQTTPKIPRNPMRGLAVTALMLLCQALAVVLDGLAPNLQWGAVVFPTLLVTLVLAIVYDQAFAIALGSAHAGLVLLTLGLPVEVTVVVLAGVLATAAQLREVRSRSKLVRVGLGAGAAMVVAAAAVHFINRPPADPDAWRRLGLQLLGVGGAGLGAGVIVQAILPFIESAFRVTTAMTLKELNDASHPLLQRLAQEAPGTYQHSLRIADMAEAAADSVGADGLLARVGAMYHDVGKINKPHYFIENQGGGPNRHNRLNPAMSLLIIVGHVKDGVEMAREFNLPRAVLHFIESHHGTTLVEYFHHAAVKAAEANNTAAPSEFEYRYPGPKPQTKEAAIMLLCDGVEGLARALDEPTPTRLQQAVHQMAMKRLMDGQFDDCNLTLAELSKVEKAITKTLTAIYHTRIKYPGQPGGKRTGDNSPPSEPVARPA